MIDPVALARVKPAVLGAAGVALWWGVGRLAVGRSFDPGGAVFAVYFLLVASTVAGDVVARFPPLPALVGQLVAGFLLRNLPGIGPAVGAAVDATFSASARTAALGVILARAGISLDVPAMWRLRWPASRLAFAPATVEALAVTLLAVPVLGMSWSYAAALGFLFAGISPAVVIPSLLALQDKGYGVEAGVPTLVVTAASVDVVYAIAGFGAVSSALPGMGEGGAAEAAWKAPAQILGGVLGGAVAGAALGAATAGPPEEEAEEADAKAGSERRKADEWSPASRASALMGVSLLALYGGAELELSGGAALAVIVASAVAARGWGGARAKAAGATLNVVWAKLAQPLLFALIGAAVDLTRLEGGIVGLGVVVLLVGLFARCGVAFLAAGGGALSRSERLFVAVAWVPKATVQAALAGLPLDAAVAAFGKDSKEAEEAELLLALGVLAIAITAPLGAAAVAASGEKLLLKKGRDQQGSAEGAGGEGGGARV